MAFRWAILGVVLATMLASGAARAQEVVHFPSLDERHTMLDGYFFPPAAGGRHPAVVFLHGCGGLFTKSHAIYSRETDWMRRLTAAGYAVLMVDSFGPRGQVEMCTAAHYDMSIYGRRARDAYGALAFLQARSDVRPDRIAVIGWSQGGGTVLHTVGTPSLGRPAVMTGPDFRAAVAFYPAQCSDRSESAAWTTAVPLLVELGADDVWIGAAACRQWLGTLTARGVPVTLQLYPGVAHDFDFPDLARRERPEFTTPSGVVPVTGTDPAARADALQLVPTFLGRYLGN